MADQKSDSEVKDEKDQKVDELDEIMKILYAGQDNKEQKTTNSIDYAGVPLPACRSKYPAFGDSFSSFEGEFSNNENVEEDLEFGRYTNRNDYFPVTPLNVYTDKDRFGVANNGGGGGRRQVFDKRLIDMETESSSGGRFYYDHAPSLKVIVLEQKLSKMQKEQHEREEELKAKLETERKRVADLEVQYAELVAKMDKQTQFEQFRAFMREYHSGVSP